MQHITVLQEESVQALALASDSVVVDCTLGSGGHARTIIDQLGKGGVYIGLDADPQAIADNQSLKTNTAARVELVHNNFRNLTSVLDELGFQTIDAILADLGWRIEQFEAGERGFSFSADEPLFMTFGNPEDYLITAKDIVNEWKEEDLANVFYGYGEERFARRIAKAIGAAREARGPIETAVQLADIIKHAVPGWYRAGKTHPATKSFQALRIAVNDEFSSLETLITDGVARLAPGGRIAIITFHSLEDRIVKQAFRSFVTAGTATLITKKPLTPSPDELARNPRARSAKLRVIQKHDLLITNLNDLE